MDRAISLEARRIDLAIELPFRLGRARVDPPAHEWTAAGTATRMQPQTMKVLVALHDRIGQVVTRDELVDRCWDGRVVGEDVINRSISLLRRFAGDGGGFRIETVPRAGYRLVETAPECPDETPAPADGALSPGRSARRTAAILASATLLAIAAIGLVAFEQLNRPTPDAVMLKPFDVAGSAPLARTLAAGVSADVGNALSAAGVDVVDPDSSGRSARAAFVLGGRAELAGPDLHVTTELEDARDHSILWSASFTRPASAIQAMQEQVAANLAGVLHCALDTAKEPGGVGLDEETIKLYLKACDLQLAVNPPSDQIDGLLKQVTAKEPRFAEGWARLALWSANAAFGVPPKEAAGFRAQARAAAATALRLNPNSGIAYEALTDMELGRVPFAQLHREFQKILTFDPNNALIINDDGELLMRMGRVDDSVEMFRRGVDLDPLSPFQVADLVKGLMDQSRAAEAQATLQRALRMWPDDNMLKLIHLDYEARLGDAKTALSILDDPDARPQVRDVTLEVYRRLIAARQSGRPADKQALVAWLNKQVAAGQVNADMASPIAAGVGDVDSAFGMAFTAPMRILADAPDPAILWDPATLGLRRDPRFIALAGRFHVADFWRMTGLWPDFCSSANPPYDCKAEAARLTQSAPAKT